MGLLKQIYILMAEEKRTDLRAVLAISECLGGIVTPPSKLVHAHNLEI